MFFKKFCGSERRLTVRTYENRGGDCLGLLGDNNYSYYASTCSYNALYPYDYV